MHRLHIAHSPDRSYPIIKCLPDSYRMPPGPPSSREKATAKPKKTTKSSAAKIISLRGLRGLR